MILAEETSVSNPPALSQSWNLFFWAILMIYNLASTTMLPELKLKKKKNCDGCNYFNIKQKIWVIASWYEPLESVKVWKLYIYLQSLVKNYSNYWLLVLSLSYFLWLLIPWWTAFIPLLEKLGEEKLIVLIVFISLKFLSLIPSTLQSVSVFNVFLGTGWKIDQDVSY